MTPDDVKEWLKATDLAMQAEGIGQGIRERVIRRMLYGTPQPFAVADVVEEKLDEPDFRRFLRAARREMPVRQNSMLRPV